MKAPWLAMKTGLKPHGKARKKQPKRVRPVSKARAKQLSLYRKLRAGYLYLNPTCSCCDAPATEIHHKAGRAGKLLLDSTYWLSICRPCHLLIDQSRTESYNRGLLLHGWNDPKKP